jgi:uncharacterized protein (TIGR01777 family)
MGLRQTSMVEAPVGEVFAWHERPGALHRLAPPWQPIRVLEEAASLRDGKAVLGLPGGVRWVAQHSGYDPPHQFVDELVSLPLRWRHTHGFEPLTSSRTLVTDEVDTPVPGSLLTQMFRYRSSQLAADLAAHRVMAGLRDGPLTVAVTGSSGLIGTALCAFLGTGGHRVIRLVRRSPRHADERQWWPDRPDPTALDGADAVVHLAGASIAGRFTDRHKRAIRESRIGPTSALASSMASMSEPPGVLVTASAIGYYGADRGDEELSEDSARGSGFLADVVADWEAAAQPAQAAAVRVVHVRTGIVQSAKGGSLKLLRPLFAAGLGGPVSPGSQWVSWIGIDDLVDIFGLALVDDRIVGPVNAVSPHPARNDEYAKTLARVLRRPALVPVPGFGPRLLLGSEGASELVEASQRVAAHRLTEVGHAYRHHELEACLRHQLGRLPAPDGAEAAPGD